MRIKRGQGLPLNVVIIAALLLIVLIVLALVFTGRLDIFHKTILGCEINGGECKGSCGPFETEMPDVKCPLNKPHCCIKINEKTTTAS
ncbi:MAG: hypothetical protein V1735_03680 [Nanoarchaeota archaeon]